MKLDALCNASKMYQIYNRKKLHIKKYDEHTYYIEFHDKSIAFYEK